MAESGHAANFAYRGQDGNMYLNGATFTLDSGTMTDANGNAWPLQAPGFLANGIGSGKALYTFSYNFAVDGGATGVITPAGATVNLPNKAIIVNGFYQVTTVFSVASAPTMSIGIVTATDLLAATLVSTMGTVGFHALIPVGTAATFVQNTAAAKPTLTIAVAAMTTGAATFYLEYVMGQ